LELQEETKNLEKKLKQDDKLLEKKKKEAETHDERLQSIDKEIAEYKQTEQDLVSEYEQVKRSHSQGDVVLTQEQEDELERLREAAAAASAEPRRELGKQTRKKETARSKADRFGQELTQAKETLAEVKRDVQEFAERKDKLEKVRRMWEHSVRSGRSAHVPDHLLFVDDSTEPGKDPDQLAGGRKGTRHGPEGGSRNAGPSGRARRRIGKDQCQAARSQGRSTP
jgi:chromosome segregation ATPase